MKNEELGRVHEQLLDSVHETAITVGRVMSEFSSRSHLAHDACHVIAFVDGLDLDDLEEISQPEIVKYAEVWDMGGFAFNSLNYILQFDDYHQPRRTMKHINYWKWNKENNTLEPEYGF
jgi:hypothetical protein